MRRILLGLVLVGAAAAYVLSRCGRREEPARELLDRDDEILVDIAGVPDDVRRSLLGDEPAHDP